MILSIHARLGNTLFYYAAIMIVWGFWRMFRRQPVDSTYWSALVIGEIMIIIQGVLGIVLALTGKKLGIPLHMLFGGLSLVVLPLVYYYTRGRQNRRDMLVYAISLLLMIALVAGALRTAGMVMTAG